MTTDAPRAPNAVTYDEVVHLASKLPDVHLHIGTRARSLKSHGRLLARFRDNDRTLVLRLPIVLRDLLRNSHPATFYLDRSYHNHPYVLVRLDQISARQLKPLLAEAYREIESQNPRRQLNPRTRIRHTQ